jgi:hypothetical protein
VGEGEKREGDIEKNDEHNDIDNKKKSEKSLMKSNEF